MLLLTGPVCVAQSPDAGLRTVEEVDHPPVDEMSGIVKSRLHDNVWWVYNDSGDRPRLFAIDSTGAVHLAPWRDGRYETGAAATALSPSGNRLAEAVTWNDPQTLRITNEQRDVFVLPLAHNE